MITNDFGYILLTNFITDAKLLSQLRNGDNASFDTLYQTCFPPIATYIIKNGGNRTEAEDVFQDTLFILLQKTKDPDFRLTSSIKTYLFSIARNQWLNHLRNNKIKTVINLETIEPIAEPGNTGNHHEEKLSSWLSKITAYCQRILKAIFFYKEPMTSLMRKMGWRNKHTAANQRYKCLQQVRKWKNKEQVQE